MVVSVTVEHSALGEVNPDYGSGVYRRRVRLVKQAQQVVAELEDTTHAFRLVLSHDDGVVTAISAQPIRFPFDSCPGAVARLQPLVGCALATDAVALREILEPGQNCTHLYDLAQLALAHAVRPGRERIYDIVVPDELEQGTNVEVSCDNNTVHAWTVRSDYIVAPAEFAGKPLKRGFYHWASQAFSGDLLEAAIVLQRGYFVAQSRRQDYMNQGGRLALADNMPQGACYTYNAGVVEKAVHTAGMGRDFTDTAEQLLKFI